MNADQLQQHDIAGKPFFQGRFGHRVAAILDDGDRTGKPADVRQCFGKDTRLVGGGNNVFKLHNGCILLTISAYVNAKCRLKQSSDGVWHTFGQVEALRYGR